MSAASPVFKCPVNSQLTSYLGGVKRVFNADAGEELSITNNTITCRQSGLMVAKKYAESTLDHISQKTTMLLYYPVINSIGETGTIPMFGLAWVTLGGVRYYLRGLMNVSDVSTVKGALFPIRVKYMDNKGTVTRHFYPACSLFRYGVMLVDKDNERIDVYPTIASEDGVVSVHGRIVYKMTDLGAFGNCIIYRFENYKFRESTEVKNCSFTDIREMGKFTFLEPKHIVHAEKLQESILLTIYKHFDVYFSVSLYGEIEHVNFVSFKCDKVTIDKKQTPTVRDI